MITHEEANKALDDLYPYCVDRKEYDLKQQAKNESNLIILKKFIKEQEQ